MSDGIPSEEQLRRIERGVQRRIDRRRTIARRVAGSTAAVLLLAGGIALVRPLALTGTASSAGSAAGGGSGSGGGSAAERVVVVCHGATTTKVAVDPAGLPGSALLGCAAAPKDEAAGDSGPASAPSPTASDPASVLCRTRNGALHVYPGRADAVCTEHGMTRVP